MKLQELLQTYEFGEIFPELALMYPQARQKKAYFKNAYDLLINMNVVESKKKILYQLMQDPNTHEMFVGADDNCFNAPWNVILGKEVRNDQSAGLTELEVTANCLLNTILIGHCPKTFLQDKEAILA